MKYWHQSLLVNLLYKSFIFLDIYKVREERSHTNHLCNYDSTSSIINVHKAIYTLLINSLKLVAIKPFVFSIFKT